MFEECQLAEHPPLCSPAQHRNPVSDYDYHSVFLSLPAGVFSLLDFILAYISHHQGISTEGSYKYYLTTAPPIGSGFRHPSCSNAYQQDNRQPSCCSKTALFQDTLLHTNESSKTSYNHRNLGLGERSGGDLFLPPAQGKNIPI